MTYKTIMAASVAFAALTGTANADCFCDNTFSDAGAYCIKTISTHTRLDPSYWVCYAGYSFVKGACKDLLCKTSPSDATKLASNQENCKEGGTNCETELDKDITQGMPSIQSEISFAVTQAQKAAEDAAKAEAKCFEDTGKSCEGD